MLVYPVGGIGALKIGEADPSARARGLKCCRVQSSTPRGPMFVLGGPKDHMNTSILHPGSSPNKGGTAEIMLCRILMWSFGSPSVGTF